MKGTPSQSPTPLLLGEIGLDVFEDRLPCPVACIEIHLVAVYQVNLLVICG
jgi:hypothetical protein